MMFPSAPTKIRATLKTKPRCERVLDRYNKYHPIRKTAMILKILSASLPYPPPRVIPNAMPSFSVKWIRNQSPSTENSSPRYIFVFTHTLNTWSISNTRKMVRMIKYDLFTICQVLSAAEIDVSDQSRPNCTDYSLPQY